MRDRKEVLNMVKKHKKKPKNDLDEPFLLSPQFDNQGGWGKKFSNWWHKYFKNVILPAMIVVLIAGGIYAYTSHQELGSEIDELTDSLTDLDQGSQIEIQENQIANVNQETTNEILPLGEQVQEKTKLTVTDQNIGPTVQQKAKPGDGVTHLARRALKEYLTNKQPGLTLSPEQKIYCEDYIQNETASRPLIINEELSFNTNLIEEAINAAQNLTDNQINNLSKYVPLVPSL